MSVMGITGEALFSRGLRWDFEHSRFVRLIQQMEEEESVRERAWALFKRFYKPFTAAARASMRSTSQGFSNAALCGRHQMGCR
jgi:hypothetical protein